MSGLILLLVCNLFWAAAPTAAKVLISEVGAPAAAWLKYAGAMAAFLLCLPLIRRAFPEPESRPLRRISPRDLGILALIGLATCTLSPLAQMRGLTASTAVNNSILVCLEPLMTLVLAWLLLRDRIRNMDALVILIAATGALILSGLASRESLADLPAALKAWSRGDLLLVFGLFCEACCSVLPRLLKEKHSGLRIYGVASTVGLALLSLILLPTYGFPRIGALSPRGWLAFFWLGPITAFSYVAWLHILQRGTSLPAMVATLYCQPVFGALAGRFVLGEPLGSRQIIGGALILGAVTWRMLHEGRASRALEPVLPACEAAP
ncbi:MAG: DMT family transporter [Elusimicrobiota bacterium]